MNTLENLVESEFTVTDIQYNCTEVKTMAKNLNESGNDGIAVVDEFEDFFAGKCNLSVFGHMATEKDREIIKRATVDGYIIRKGLDVATELYFNWCRAYLRPYIAVTPAKKYSRISISFESILGSKGYSRDDAEQLNNWAHKPRKFNGVGGIFSIFYVRNESILEFVKKALELATAHDSEQLVADANESPTVDDSNEANQYQYEKDICWIRNPSDYKFLREQFGGYRPTRKFIDDSAHIYIGYAIHYSAREITEMMIESRTGYKCWVGSDFQRIWYVAPWDLPGHPEYTGKYRPREAIDPASVRVGKESKKSPELGYLVSQDDDGEAATV
jgi:hypothetical protein